MIVSLPTGAADAGPGFVHDAVQTTSKLTDIAWWRSVPAGLSRFQGTETS